MGNQAKILKFLNFFDWNFKFNRKTSSFNRFSNYTFHTISDFTKKANFATLKTTDLGKHIKTVHEKIKDFKCEICEKAFISNSDLKRHINAVHAKTKNFGCTQCGKCFSQSGHLNQHIKSVHEGIRENKCALCDNSFSRSENLRRHLKDVHQVSEMVFI